MADGVFGHGLMRTVRHLFLPASPFTDRRSLLVSVGLSLLFTALMVPNWLDALSKLDSGTAAWSKVIGVAYAAAYMAFVLIGRLEAWLPRALLCVATIALGTALVVLMGLGNAWLLIFALCVILTFARRAVSLVVVALAFLGVVLAGLATGSLAEALPNLVVLGSVSVAIGLLAWLFDVNNELRHARDQIATLAVDRERERFSRDLHDLLGHSITTITVKAGLVRRLLESGRDPAIAIAEAHDVERLARQALVDVRAAVSDYRTVTLSAELAAVGEALRTAGIEARLPLAVDDVAPELQQVFGYVLREAVTNVVRHSRAGRVSIRLGRDWLLVEDDGQGTDQLTEGNGLRGLKERMQAVGGVLEAGPRPGGGYAVRAGAWVEQRETAGTSGGNG